MRRLACLAVVCLAVPAAAAAAPSKDAAAWAKPQIQRVVKAGFLAPSVASFRGSEPLDQAGLQSVIESLNAIFAEQPPVEADPWTLEAPAPPWTFSSWKATSPAQPVTVTEFDRVLVNALGLANAAKRVRVELQRVGLKPPARVGTETVARLLGLRINHPAGQDDLELLPDAPITRAEAAYSVAQVLDWNAERRAAYDGLVQQFALPDLTSWQQRVLTTAVSYVGMPYVWGGTDPAAGFDCSGFVWRVYKLTPYADAGGLAGTLRGRTTYQMSGEIGAKARIAKVENLQPGDVLFFGKGPRSKPAEVDHTGIYLGNGWFVHSSRYGTTIAPFDGWYRSSFAWARRPLREAGLAA